MIRSTFESWLNEPQVGNPPRRVWRDPVIVGAIWVSVILEVLLRNDIHAPWVAAPLVALLSISLLWRRTKPLLASVSVFGGVLLFDILAVLAGYRALNIYSAAFLLISMYSLFRWGSGRGMAIGSVFGFALYVASNIFDYTGVSDTISGLIVLEFPAAAGLAVRYLSRSREQAREQIRVGERERLARELHDTLAHHVSAIAIQAQAGRFVADSGSLDGAAGALEIIEEEASRTLAEMRSIVGTLRDVATPVEMAPQHTLADITALATTTGRPTVRVSLADEATNAGPSVGVAIYRITQESITNARRHARNATDIEVTVEVTAEKIVLTVTDNGDPPGTPSSQGFGLIGMAERATLLGGTLDAGPAPTRGWQVRAVLPAHLARTETP